MPSVLLSKFAMVVPVAMWVAACATQPEPPKEPPAAAPPYDVSATMKDIMLHVVDPAADDVWLSVTTISTAAGTVETVPQNDEEWAKARRGAVTLMEAANMLMIPGRQVARPGEKSETPGVELEPEEMEANIAKDQPQFFKAALGLHGAATDALKAIDAKDAQKLFELGEAIERACEHCHSTYWYPNEKIPQFAPDPPTHAAPAEAPKAP
jgi:hypothetical protein